MFHRATENDSNKLNSSHIHSYCACRSVPSGSRLEPDHSVPNLMVPNVEECFLPSYPCPMLRTHYTLSNNVELIISFPFTVCATLVALQPNLYSFSQNKIIVLWSYTVGSPSQGTGWDNRINFVLYMNMSLIQKVLQDHTISCKRTL